MNFIADTAEQDRNRRRKQIEALAISVCRIRRLPDPDPDELHQIVSEVMSRFGMSERANTEACPDEVVELIVSSLP